jgi:hypothetical protein
VSELEREREEPAEVLTNDATWRRSCGDDHTMALNRGGRWSSMGRWFQTRGEIEARVDAMDNGGSLVVPFIGPKGDERRMVKGRVIAVVELQ